MLAVGGGQHLLLLPQHVCYVALVLETLLPPPPLSLAYLLACPLDILRVRGDCQAKHVLLQPSPF